MLIYRLDNDRLILVGDDSDENLAGLVQQPGVESALADGQCAVVSGAWVVPHVVTVANAPYADALDLDWSSETVATPNRAFARHRSLRRARPWRSADRRLPGSGN